ncbi:MAG TPA: hypothetical protein VF281_03015, partial [Candidatus Saccharimonadales bacterium]
FTPTQDAGAVVVDFCQNSPVLGEECTAPAGFDASTATASGGFTLGTLATAEDNKVMVTGSMTEDVATSVILTGVKNPTSAGTVYARILTYTNGTGAAAYESETPGAHFDDGGVALSITPTIGVSGAVLESMLFCVSKDTIDPNCTGTLGAPTLRLGQDVGGVISLNSLAVYTGTINTQISTNAVSGAVISLKSSAVGCGGLINSSNTGGCFIKPALQTGIASGDAKFGVKTAADVVDATNGTIRAFPASGYNASTFALNWVTGDGTGVTSTYGDPILDTDSKPANNRNMALTFGASASNQTPAGNYSADLSLIATGKF